MKNMRQASASYQPGSTVLTFEQAMSPEETTAMQTLLWHTGDIEGSSNSEGSHATSDSGRYSHDETEMTNLSSGLSSEPSCLPGEESGGSDGEGLCGEPNQLLQKPHADSEVKKTVEDQRCHTEEHGSSDPTPPPLHVCESVAE